jgi:hypothetical protein
LTFFKKKNDNDIIDSNVEVTTVPMKVFNESFFCDIEATIRNNKVDIAEVQLYSKNRKFI